MNPLSTDQNIEVRRACVMVNFPGEAQLAALRRAREIAGPDRRLEVVAEDAERLGLGADETFADSGGEPDLCLALGGDGTILRALRRFADTEVPVFAVNFGRIGFLATIEAKHLDTELHKAFSGQFDVMALPALEAQVAGERLVALNDVTFTRRPSSPVAELAYSLDGTEIGHVRCDGLVAATPAGSTGYNLANNGPVMAWGVEGFVVSFIAPHTLTARALVVAPGDVLHVRNAGRNAVDVVFDGVAAPEPLARGAEVEVRFCHDVSRLAQLPTSSFYLRIREKFGRLAN